MTFVFIYFLVIGWMLGTFVIGYDKLVREPAEKISACPLWAADLAVTLSIVLWPVVLPITFYQAFRKMRCEIRKEGR